MKYLDEYRDAAAARRLAAAIARRATRPWTIMEVCGGQTHTIVRYGIDALLPAAGETECRGVLVSGESLWGAPGLAEKTVLWDEAKRHLVVLLPNEKLTTLQERLTPA